MTCLFLFININIRKLSGSREQRVGVTTFPAQLNTRSESADVGGMARIFLARGERQGK